MERMQRINGDREVINVKPSVEVKQTEEKYTYIDFFRSFHILIQVVSNLLKQGLSTRIYTLLLY